MLANTARARRRLGAAAASIFGLGVAAVMGVVARVGEVTEVRTADARPFGMEEPVHVPVETVPETTTRW
jgi:hypothetical protein